MRFRLMPCEREIHTGEGPGGMLLHGDILRQRKAIAERYAGQVQTMYLDPPFFTGKSFVMRQRIGTAGWETGKPVIELPAYGDRWANSDAFLTLMRGAVELSHALLKDDGSMFLHIDARMHAHMRLLLDEVFGEKNFVNEIIWVYQSGGRSMAHFSRKHDVILFYRKNPQAYFNIREVGVPRGVARKNHMRRGVDEEGRTYRSIVSQGKEYRYYDDEPAFPGDVWDDVSHMQQKDPQRTGYDNQKPMRLLERVVRSTSRPEDLICDLFAGSGTTGVAAQAHGRRFLLVDKAAVALVVARKRLLGKAMRIEAPCDSGTPTMAGTCHQGLGIMQLRLETYKIEEGLLNMDLEGVEAVDQLSVGYLRGDTFHAYASAARSRLTPALPEVMELPVLEGLPAMLTVDVLGRKLLHVLEGLDDGE